MRPRPSAATTLLALLATLSACRPAEQPQSPSPPPPPVPPMATPYIPADHAWAHRPVLIFGPTDDPRVAEQQARFNGDPAALSERDMVVLTNPDLSGAPNVQPPTPDAFAVILIGKDTGEKARWTAVVDPADVFAQIDTMPMRQREMGN